MHCTTEKMTAGYILTNKNVINASPSYQRESGVWSTDKQQLFLDSIYNGFDVPKFYFHDLRGNDPRYDFAVIDGKQRLTTIWRYLDSAITLAADFKMTVTVRDQDLPPAGARFRDMSSFWQEYFKNKAFDVVLVQNAEEEDIEELFSRLNNGEPLNAAEKRNAMGGNMCQVIRDVSQHAFFQNKASFTNMRYQYYEVAAKFLLIEQTESNGGDPFCDLKKKFLDKMVKDYSNISIADSDSLKHLVDLQLKNVNRIFGRKDPLLSKQAYPPLYYLFTKTMIREYAHPQLYKKLKQFIPEFHVLRQSNYALPEEDRDPALIEFGRLIQQGTNDRASLSNRVSILRRFFLQKNPDVLIRDTVRDFNEDEKLAIYLMADKKCAICHKQLNGLDEMQADHHRQWAHGGQTSLQNGRALCESCNQAEALRVQ